MVKQKAITLEIRLACMFSILGYALALVSCNIAPTERPPYTDFEYSVTRTGGVVRLAGQPYEIPAENCGGTRDSVQTTTRSRRFLAELDIEISGKLAAEFGGSVEVATAVLRGEIGTALGIKIGAETETSSSVEIVTPPGKRTITTLQWEENWTTGDIAIIRPDGTYVDVLPFTALNSVTLKQLSVQTVDCDSGEVVSQEVTPETLPVIVPAITPTPTPVSLGTLTVPGNSNEGIRFTASQPGQYILKYVGGAYSTYPEGSIPAGKATWLTSVRIFKNRPAEWNGIAISDLPDIHAVNFGYSLSASEAESKAQGQTATVSLLQGDYLILVAVDGHPYYSDNPGEVVFEILFIPAQ